MQMPEETVLVAEPLQAEGLAARLPIDRRIRWFELSLVTLVCFGQYFLISVNMLNNPRSVQQPSSTSSHLTSILHEVTGLLLVGYVLARRKLRFKDLGLRWSIWDAWSGMAVVAVSYFVYYAGYQFIRIVAYSISPASNEKQAFHWGHFGYAMIPFLLLNPFFEELIVRAYLMTELRELTGSPVLAVVASVAVQTTYHLYYGWVGALSLGFMFLAFSVYYAATKRITPVIVAHAILDLSALFH